MLKYYRGFQRTEKGKEKHGNNSDARVELGTRLRCKSERQERPFLIGIKVTSEFEREDYNAPEIKT